MIMFPEFYQKTSDDSNIVLFCFEFSRHQMSLIRMNIGEIGMFSPNGFRPQRLCSMFIRFI